MAFFKRKPDENLSGTKAADADCQEGVCEWPLCYCTQEEKEAGKPNQEEKKQEE